MGSLQRHRAATTAPARRSRSGCSRRQPLPRCWPAQNRHWWQGPTATSSSRSRCGSLRRHRHPETAAASRRPQGQAPPLQSPCCAAPARHLSAQWAHRSWSARGSGSKHAFRLQRTHRRHTAPAGSAAKTAGYGGSFPPWRWQGAAARSHCPCRAQRRAPGPEASAIPWRSGCTGCAGCSDKGRWSHRSQRRHHTPQNRHRCAGRRQNRSGRWRCTPDLR